MDSKISTELRVMSCTIKQIRSNEFDKESGLSTFCEVLDVRASGIWTPETDMLSENKLELPVSVHITVYPGCGAIPVMGDKIRVTIEQAQ